MLDMDGRTIGRPFLRSPQSTFESPLNWGKTRPATTVELTLVLPQEPLFEPLQMQ